MNSNSWFVEVKKLFWKYELGEIEEALNDPAPKSKWKNIVYKKVSENFKEKITSLAKLYKSLKYMNITYTSGKIHPNIQTTNNSMIEINRLPVKLKL